MALLPLNCVVLVSAYLLSPILPLFASKDGWLPKCLWWYQTPDNPLDGDYGFRMIHAPFKGEDLSYWKKYINRMFWMIRNPSYGFDWTVLAFNPEPGYVLKVVRGSHPIGGDTTIDGYYHAILTNPNGSKAWQLYVIHHWNKTRYAKIDLGWRLWQAPNVCQYMSNPFSVWKFRDV